MGPEDARAGAPQTGPPLERSLNPSTQATINAVPCRAEPGREKSRRRRQYPVHAPQSRGLQLRHRIPGRLPGLRRDRGARPVAPTAQRLRRDPRIPGDLIDRPGLRRTRAARLSQQPDGLRPELRRASRALRHGPIISHRARENTEQKQFISDGHARRVHGRAPAHGLRARGSHPCAGRVVRPDAGRAAQEEPYGHMGLRQGGAHKGRNMVERVFNRMKRYRKAATRYDRLDEVFLAAPG